MKKTFATTRNAAFILLVVTQVITLKMLYDHRVIDTKLNAVAYANGTAELLVTDSVPNQNTHIYRATVPAIGAAPWWYAPTLKTQGSAWQRAVYTFDNTESDTCDDDIFYIDRVKKTAKTIHIDSCIQGTLDEHDITHFLSTTYRDTFQTLTVGTYEDGATVASHDGAEHLSLQSWAFNWELNRAVLYFGKTLPCALDELCVAETPALYSWNLSTSEWTNIPLPSYTSLIDPDASTLTYSHDTDTFTFSPHLQNGIVARSITVK
jgi:hypothetical protein